MRTDDLLEFYRRDNRTTTVLNSLESEGRKVELRNVVGSALPLSVCGLLERELESDTKSRHHLFVLENKEAAAYFMNDVEQILVKNPRPSLLFPLCLTEN